VFTPHKSLIHTPPTIVKSPGQLTSHTLIFALVLASDPFPVHAPFVQAIILLDLYSSVRLCHRPCHGTSEYTNIDCKPLPGRALLQLLTARSYIWCIICSASCSQCHLPRSATTQWKAYCFQSLSVSLFPLPIQRLEVTTHFSLSVKLHTTTLVANQVCTI
jgi:hypothetical protein